MIDTTAEVKPQNINWANGPWRKIQPGENPDPQYIDTNNNGEKIIPTRIYGNAAQAPQPTTSIQEPAINSSTSDLRLSKGAIRLINEANHIGIDPTPYLAETHPKPGAKVPVKGPLARLRESVQMKISNIRK